MKTSLKTGVAALMLLSVIACKKESVPANRAASATDASKLASFIIGQEYGGGIIVYIDETGEHGIIAAKTDQSLGATWYNGDFYVVTGATGKDLGTGPYNTRKIIRAQGVDAIYAARDCAAYRAEGFNDWYLPSKNELAEVFKQKALLGIGNDVYWSSTEVDANIAWAQNFETGGRKQSNKNKVYHVRAVRTF